MDKMSYRPAKLSINLEAIKRNVANLKQDLNDKTEIIAIVKANGYGHGAIPVAKAAIEAGAMYLGVALLEEAIELREAGIKVPILVMGWVSPKFASVAIDYDITLTVFQVSWLETYAQQNDTSKKLSINIKLDTGMGRIGIRTIEELDHFLNSVDQTTTDVTGVFTHFSTADDEDASYYKKQVSRFEPLLERIREHLEKELLVHVGNSAASLRQASDLFDAVRFGVGMYGLYPSEFIKETSSFPLDPALSLVTELTHVKKLPAKEAVGYGATYQTGQDEWIGTIPIGYGDGIIRKWQGLDVLIDGERMPLVGRICMDQCMVKLDQAYPIGTEVVFIGKQGNQKIAMEDVADKLDTINYEVACLFTNRLPRRYF